MFARDVLSMLDDVEAPSDADFGEVVPTDHVVGELSLELRQLHGLMLKLLDQAASAERDWLIASAKLHGRKCTDKDRQDISRLQQRYYLANDQAKAVRELFWASVKTDFPEVVDKDGVSLCRGWKVAWNDSPLREFMNRFAIR